MNASTSDTGPSAAPFACSPGVKALLLLALLGESAFGAAAPIPSGGSGIRTHSYSLPLTFEANQGQTDARVNFLARGENYTLFLTPTEAVFALSRPETVMRMQLAGSARDSRVQGLEELAGKVNYIRGNDSAQWRTNVRTYKRVQYTAVYPGIDLAYYGRPQQLEYDFIIAPGADPSAIRLAFVGVDEATVDDRGDLVLTANGATLRLRKPVIYQNDGVRRQTIKGRYVHKSKSPREIGFRVGAYDRTRALIIDPVLSYATYLGGSGEERGDAIAVDAAGAAYVIGSTASTDFPIVNALQPTRHGGHDVFVAKLRADGTALGYATYVGGRGDDDGSGIAVDASGNAYITGQTQSPDFPTKRALQPTRGGELDAFVAKLSADGSQLVYSTYLGGSGEDSNPAIAVDLRGAAYISGSTSSLDFPAVNAFQPASSDVLCEPLTCSDGFIAKLTPDGTALAYSSYLGGSGVDFGLSIAVDSQGAAYVVGDTRSVDFPLLHPTQPHAGFEQDGNAFVTKFAPSGRTLVYSTYLGGSRYDRAVGVAVDATGAAYVTGDTDSSDFPTVNPLQSQYRDGRDMFVAKLPPQGGALAYSTYLGGDNFDVAGGIAVDTAGAAHVTGMSFSPNFHIVKPAVQPTCASCVVAGAADAIVAKLAPDGESLLQSTFLGGSSVDEGTGIAVDVKGATYVTGVTGSGDFPTVQPLQASVNGVDAFVTKFSVTDPPLPRHVVLNPVSADFPAQSRDIAFGASVAIRNGIAFVGIPKAADGGHVAVLYLTTSGWQRGDTIKLPLGIILSNGEAEFGRSLTWRDEMLIVGGSKAAYFFTRTNGIWTFRDLVRPDFLSPDGVFPVALRFERGDTDIVGSPQLHGVGTLLASEFGASCCPSRVHIFHLDPTRRRFLYVGFVQPSDSRLGDNFGADLSMTNRAFVVGSPRGARSRIAGLPAYDQSGAAYIFRRGTDGRWKQGQKLLPSEPAPGFGTSVAIDNDMIIVGAPKIDIEGLPAGRATPDGHTAGGAAYVFVPGVGRYVQARKLRPGPDQLFQYQEFGYRIAMFGPQVVIAAARPYVPDGSFPFGLAVAYTRDGTSLLPHGIAQGQVIAASMALANNWLLLGVPYERSCPSGCVGSAHIYDVNRLP